MKKYLAILAILALCAAPCMAAEDTTGLEYLTIGAPANYTNGVMYTVGEGAANTNSLDIGPYKGRAVVVITMSADLSGVATTNTTAPILQHATSATGTYSAVSGVAFDAITTGAYVDNQNVDLSALHRYVRVGFTLLGTNAVQRNASVIMVAPHLSD
jgi:hypothetical protein